MGERGGRRLTTPKEAPPTLYQESLLELPIPLTCSGIFTITGRPLWQIVREGWGGYSLSVCVCVSA